MENIQNFRAGLFCKIYIVYLHDTHIGFHNYSKLILLVDLFYTSIAHEVLPVSLVDSVTAKVDDEEKDLAYSIYMWYTSQDEGQKEATRKVEDSQKTLFPRIVRGPLGCHLLSSLVPKSRFRESGKIIFFKKSFEAEKDAELPPECFPCGGSV